MTIADRLDSLGIELPPPFPPAGNYLSCVVDEGLVYVGGHGPVAGDQVIRGKVAAVGLAELPLGIAVEVELIARLRT